ncbi:hypothetical protein AALP_AA2G137500 [Arabis alpina]|uniref:MATH domain-containing protein n=1 Tax=Arabis alpina TaxID=50452 RepID=A0A087HH93_ARAAL|nr:hypothetical protein AALP_AA2G137500 [Arabis alpina]
MENEDGDKFTWVMSLPFSQMGSKDFVFGGCKWFLKLVPMGTFGGSKFLSLFLVAASCFTSLPCRWRRHAKYRLTIAEIVKRIFARHPDMALEIRTKNQDMRTSYINVMSSSA